MLLPQCRDLVGLFQELDIAYSNWDYKGGFGLIEPDGTDTGIVDSIPGDASA